MSINDFPPSYILPLTMIVWLLAALKSTLFYSYYWQLKEYRWDRMGEFLKSPKGKSLLLSPFNALRIILLGVFLYDFLYPRGGEQFSVVALTGIMALGLMVVYEFAKSYFHHSFFRPKPTLRMLMILAGIFCLEILALWYFPNKQLTVFALEILRPLLLTFFVHLVGLPFYILKKTLMLRAAKKRKSLQQLKVIGITGSYGKSSTKEFLYQILGHKFKTAKTEEHVNVDIGIARTILNNVDSSHQVLIVEMGAYRKGEIASSCNIAAPEIGILTGINEQHLSFFGSIENTIRAKGELLAGLPQDGLAIVNADNANAAKALQYNGANRVMLYSSKISQKTAVDLCADAIEQTEKGLTFRVKYGKKDVEFKVPVFGEHFVQNILACVACALELGLTLEEIADYARSCQVLQGSLQLFSGKNGVKILDDSYNSNPDGFVSALKSLKNLNMNRNILVTPGMLELGEKNEELHEMLGKKIAEVCSVVFVTSADSFGALQKGIKEADSGKVGEKPEIFLVTDYEELKVKIKEKIEPGSAILFENRVPKNVIEQFKS